MMKLRFVAGHSILERGNERSELTAFMQAERESPSAPASINAIEQAIALARPSTPALRANPKRRFLSPHSKGG